MFKTKTYFKRGVSHRVMCSLVVSCSCVAKYVSIDPIICSVVL
jgi:hypothetical protein